MSFAFYKGFLSSEITMRIAGVKSQTKWPMSSPQNQSLHRLKTPKKLSPLRFTEIGKQYQEFKDSLSAVMVRSLPVLKFMIGNK